MDEIEKRRKERLEEIIKIDINEEGISNFSIVISRGDNAKTKKIEDDLSKVKIPWRGISMQLQKHIAEDLAEAILEIAGKIKNKEERITIDIRPFSKESRWDTIFQIRIYSEGNFKEIKSSYSEQMSVDGDMAKMIFNQEIAKKFAEAILETI